MQCLVLFHAYGIMSVKEYHRERPAVSTPTCLPLIIPSLPTTRSAPARCVLMTRGGGVFHRGEFSDLRFSALMFAGCLLPLLSGLSCRLLVQREFSFDRFGGSRRIFGRFCVGPSEFRLRRIFSPDFGLRRLRPNIIANEEGPEIPYSIRWERRPL